MEQFGDELIIQSFKIPWLIWIHLLVTVLLVILLFFGFTVFTSDDSISPGSATAASPSTYSAAAVPAHLSKPSSSNRKSKGQLMKFELEERLCSKVEDMRVRRDAGTSGGTSRDEDQIVEEPSGKDSMFSRIFRHPNHPCSYLGLAKKALFKCFGFDSRDSPSSQHEKQE
ncbi:uncharacterized protein [Henckelia pumila]|uniref:uncharacterized protein isoform X1 n=1 Tax=Henckelia pumila TaxID=405737 RepID=UPI003C6E6F6B